MRILITGVSGTIGSHLVENLVRDSEQHEVIGIQKTDRPRTTLKLMNLASEITLEEVDIRNYQQIKNLISYYRPEKIVHLAAQTVIARTKQNAVGTYRTNVLGTVNILEAIRTSDIDPAIIYQSTDKVFGEGVNKDVNEPYKATKAYGTSKACSDLVAKSYKDSYNLNLRIVRSTNIFGYESNNRRIVSNTIVDCLNGIDPKLFENIEGVRGYIYAEDYAAALRRILEVNKGIYNISSDVSLSQEKVVKKILDYFPEREADIQEKEDYDEINKLGLNCSNFGWTPENSFEEGISKTIERYKKWGFIQGEL